MRWIKLLRSHQALTLLVFFLFLIHVLMADRHSYWLDELYAVKIYGTDPKSAFSMVKDLLTRDTHPPLYHLILFNWIKLFGSTEFATRILSSFYILASVVLLYSLAFEFLSRRLAIASSFLYGLSVGAMDYAIQARPYAQTLLLCVLSSFLLWRWLEAARTGRFLNCYAAFLVVCNVGLMLTHYYNAFFLIAQGTFVTLFFLLRSGHRLQDTIKVLLLYLIQGLLVALLIGPFFLSTYHDKSEEYHAASPTSPVTMMVDLVLRQNFPFISNWLALVLAAAILGLVTRTIVPCLRRTNDVTLNSDFVFFLLSWMIIPCLAAYTVFFATGFEKLKWRYIIYCLPPASILVAVAIEAAITLSATALRQIGASIQSGHVDNVINAALVVTIALTIPGVYEVAAYEKDPFRDVAKSIVTLVEEDPRSSYMVYEAGLRREAMLDHYLSRYSDRVRAAGTIRPIDERNRGAKMLPAIAAEMAKYDFLVIAFPHEGVTDYPNFIKLLSQRYDVRTRQIDRSGMGYIVFEKRQARVVN